ncbi:SPOR domain-containing protein [Saccharospirillum salsuginis]|uniref:SPOR domain-containing protein n=1 Tax=Saccharospirillum salsuginis TaxID=418750 RepID=A0A918N8Q1_9GAMM|nr:SPOR domain-containing protein [Saccharospirillum salsuginis]GGX47922.1 hypothetical protein GCM10007392_13490 [Saccharospirillum salsuginis]
MVLASAVAHAEGPQASEPIPPEGAIPMESDEPVVIELDWPEETEEPAPAEESGAPAEPTPVVPDMPVAQDPVTPATDNKGLPAGEYLQLAFFESAESVARFKRQIAGKAWAGDVRYWFDDQEDGHRVLLGPLSSPELARQRQRLRAEGFESFRYRAGS